MVCEACWWAGQLDPLTEPGYDGATIVWALHHTNLRRVGGGGVWRGRFVVTTTPFTCVLLQPPPPPPGTCAPPVPVASTYSS